MGAITGGSGTSESNQMSIANDENITKRELSFTFNDDDDEHKLGWRKGCGRPIRQARRIHTNRTHPSLRLHKNETTK
jgi:hypothetical protein